MVSVGTVTTFEPEWRRRFAFFPIKVREVFNKTTSQWETTIVWWNYYEYRTGWCHKSYVDRRAIGQTDDYYTVFDL